MLRITWLFILFGLSESGRVRIARWQELRAACLERTYAGQRKPATTRLLLKGDDGET